MPGWSIRPSTGPAAVQQADQGAEERPPGDEGAGAVDRVEHPEPLGLRPARRRTPRPGCRGRGSARGSSPRIACSAARSASVTGEASPLASTSSALRNSGRMAAPARSAAASAAASAPSGRAPTALPTRLRLRRVGRDALEVGDHVRPLLGVADAGEGHAGAGRVGVRLEQPGVHVLVGPGPALALQRRRVVEPSRMPVRRADDAVEVRPDAAPPALG